MYFQQEITLKFMKNGLILAYFENFVQFLMSLPSKMQKKLADLRSFCLKFPPKFNTFH